MAANLTGAMTKIVEVLSPLEAVERQRVIQAALALLGDGSAASAMRHSGATVGGGGDIGGVPGEFSQQASAWMKRATVTLDQVEQFFHVDGGKAVVISIPRSAIKRIDQVIAIYLLQGTASLLTSGEASFTDAEARERCEHFGCYDSTNHSKYIKEFGNQITGSKGSGWKLTAPGMAAAAELIKQ